METNGLTCASATRGIMMPGMVKGSGSAMKSPYRGLATRMKPINPRAFALLRMAVTVEVPLRKDSENEHMTMLPSTTSRRSASGCWQSSTFSRIDAGWLPFTNAASLADTSLNWKSPSPGVGAND